MEKLTNMDKRVERKPKRDCFDHLIEEIDELRTEVKSAESHRCAVDIIMRLECTECEQKLFPLDCDDCMHRQKMDEQYKKEVHHMVLAVEEFLDVIFTFRRVISERAYYSFDDKVIDLACDWYVEKLVTRGIYKNEERALEQVRAMIDYMTPSRAGHVIQVDKHK